MRPRNWNEYTLNPLTRIYWRASLVPAAAVIAAPIAYIKVVAVKKLVVGSRAPAGGAPFAASTCPCFRPRSAGTPPVPLTGLPHGGRDVYFEKIRVLKAGSSPE